MQNVIYILHFPFSALAMLEHELYWGQCCSRARPRPCMDPAEMERWTEAEAEAAEEDALWCTSKLGRPRTQPSSHRTPKYIFISFESWEKIHNKTYKWTNKYNIARQYCNTLKMTAQRLKTLLSEQTSRLKKCVWEADLTSRGCPH